MARAAEILAPTSALFFTSAISKIRLSKDIIQIRQKKYYRLEDLESIKRLNIILSVGTDVSQKNTHNKVKQKVKEKMKQPIRTKIRILEAREVPPVSSFTLASRKGVSALPVIFFSLMTQLQGSVN